MSASARTMELSVCVCFVHMNNTILGVFHETGMMTIHDLSIPRPRMNSMLPRNILPSGSLVTI